jgi:S-DNA-T family DNA segregation ATPase FtsK/SpoIIIE
VYSFDHPDEQVSKTVMQDWGLRLLLTLSSKKAKFKLFDIKGNGRNFPTLVGLHQSIITNDVIDNSQEIRDYLQELRQHEGHLTMNILKGKTSLEEYNRAFPEQAVPYHFLFIANFPVGFTEDTITTLRNIIQHGKESGIYVFMTTTSITEELSSSVQRIAEEIQTKYAANVFEWSSYAGIKENTKDFDWEEALRTTGTRVEYDDTLFNRELLIQAINAEASTVKKVITKVTVEQSELWTKNSSPGLTIPIGRTVSQGIQNFTFGFDSEVYHGLVGGKTGSGKSVLLHNIIVNGARLYSPDELQFILLDYKEGTEFKIYAGLPHTRVLSIDSEREFGLSVLEFLQETINERGKAFKEAGVANITDYRSATNKKLPRFVVVIDEFQVLLSGGDTLAVKSSDVLADIVKRGRSFGIHILLSTQTLFDTDISVSTLSNIGLRIGLMMQEADAVKLMHFDNIAPSKLQRAGQAIYNTRNGLAEGNEEFQISFTTGEEIKEGVAAIQHYAESVAYQVAHECVVFDGTSEGNISTNSELMKAIQNKNFTVNDASAIAYIGEPALMQSSHCGIKFRKQFGSHTLIVGQDEVAAISIVYHSLYQILHQSSSGSRVVVFDFFNVDSNLRGQFASLKEQFDTVDIISRTSRVQEVIQEFYDETKARMDDETRPGRWILVILNLHNAHSLQEDYSIQDQFKEILKNGPEGGIHVILYSNTYQPLQEVVGRDGINRCSTKIALSGSDSIQLFDTYNLKPIKKLSTAMIQTHGTKYDYDSIKVYSLDKSKLQ